MQYLRTNFLIFFFVCDIIMVIKRLFFVKAFTTLNLNGGPMRIAIMIILFLTLFGGVNYYLARRVWRCVRFLFPSFSIIIPLSVFAVLTVIMVLSVARPFSSTIGRIISTVGAYWMGMFVYLLLFFLVSDLIIFIIGRFHISIMDTVRFVAGTAAVALALITSIYGFVHATKIYTEKYDVKLSNDIKGEMRVVMLSDIHLGSVGSEERLEKMVERINALDPDIVCVAGDFFDNDFNAIKAPDKAAETLRKISSKYGVFTCLGNHDTGSTFDKMTAFLENANIRALNDEYVVIDNRLILAGRLDGRPIGEYKEMKRKKLADVLSGANPNLPVVMLDHNPANISEYKGEADLILCGHTHKGQIFPGNIITNAIYTVDYGYFRDENGTQVIVTSGIGTWGLPMRVGTNSEIVSINLSF